MADYAPEAISVDGVTPTPRTAAAGDKLTSPGDGRMLRVINGAGAPITLTITPSGTTAYGVANPVKTFSITNATAKCIPIPSFYGVPTDAGKVALSWSATPSITFEYTRI